MKKQVDYHVMKLFIGLVVMILFGCQVSSKDKTNNESPLHGEWRNISLSVELDKKHGEPSEVFKVDEMNWEDKLKIRPIRTYFRSDGTFNSEHYNLNDSLIMNPKGTWTATDKEVIMITTSPFYDTTTCTYAIKDDVVSFGCWVDWDEDGEKDDWYLGTQKKFNEASN